MRPLRSKPHASDAAATPPHRQAGVRRAAGRSGRSARGQARCLAVGVRRAASLHTPPLRPERARAPRPADRQRRAARVHDAGAGISGDPQRRASAARSARCSVPPTLGWCPPRLRVCALDRAQHQRVLAHPKAPTLAPTRAGFGGMRAMSSPAAAASTDNFKVDVNSDGIAVVTMDFAGMKVNALARHVVEELPDLMDSLEADASVRAIVFVSAKKDFIVGADIKMFKELAVAGRDGVKAMVTASHPVFDKMASGKPKIAAINGSCLGGGAEFALACHYRIAATTASLGFPEVPTPLPRQQPLHPPSLILSPSLHPAGCCSSSNPVAVVVVVLQ